MKAAELVGFRCIRTKPFLMKNGASDSSYTWGQPVIITKVTEDHLHYRTHDLPADMTDFTVPIEWDDGNWEISNA